MYIRTVAVLSDKGDNVLDMLCFAVCVQCGISASPLQVLCGHHDTVTCVTIVTELDMAVSGAKVARHSYLTFIGRMV